VLSEALRYPLGGRAGRDAFATCTGLVLALLVLFRVGSGLWPTPFVAIPVLLAVVSASLFAGYLGRVLSADPGRSGAPPFAWSVDAFRVGLRLLVVAGVYLLPAVVALFGTAFVLIRGGGGSLLTIAPTVALLVTVASVYVLPGALSAAAHRDLRAGFSRRSLGGLASGSYFFAWTVATSLVVVAWSALATAGVATVAAVLGAVAVAYTHVVAARILGEGLFRSPWEPEP
jgi:hypothetical protein